MLMLYFPAESCLWIWEGYNVLCKVDSMATMPHNIFDRLDDDQLIRCYKFFREVTK